MKLLRIFISLIALSSLLLSNSFSHEQIVVLKKDEVERVLVKYGDVGRVFKFRWTLFVNEGLVIHRSYDRVVAQNILYNRHKNRAFKQELKTRGTFNHNVPYIIVLFQEFDYQKQEAIFKLMLSDKSGTIKVKYLNKEKRK